MGAGMVFSTVLSTRVVEEFSNLTASGKKLFFSLVVLARMLRSLLPEGIGVNSSCAGWVGSWRMERGLSLHLVV